MPSATHTIHGEAANHNRVCIANLGVYSNITVGQSCGQLAPQGDHPAGQEPPVSVAFRIWHAKLPRHKHESDAA